MTREDWVTVVFARDSAKVDLGETPQVTDPVTGQVTDPVTGQVREVLKSLKEGPLSAKQIMDEVGFSHRQTFRENYINPALDAGLIERTIPEKPKSRLQQYRLTEMGREMLESFGENNI